MEPPKAILEISLSVIHLRMISVPGASRFSLNAKTLFITYRLKL